MIPDRPVVKPMTRPRDPDEHDAYCPGFGLTEDHAGLCRDQAGYPRQPDPDPLIPPETEVYHRVVECADPGCDFVYVHHWPDRRQRPRSKIGGLLLALAVTAVFWLTVGFFAGRASAAGPSEPAPEPSFVPVPTMAGEVRSVPSAPAVKPITNPGLATPKLVVQPRPTPRPKPAPVARGPVIRGSASWCAPTPRYCHGWGGTARLAAVPTFRYGDRRYLIRVCAGSRCVTATVVSFCACRAGRIVDLTPYLFRQLAPLDRGVVAVTVRRL